MFGAKSWTCWTLWTLLNDSRSWMIVGFSHSPFWIFLPSNHAAPQASGIPAVLESQCEQTSSPPWSSADIAARQLSRAGTWVESKAKNDFLGLSSKYVLYLWRLVQLSLHCCDYVAEQTQGVQQYRVMFSEGSWYADPITKKNLSGFGRCGSVQWKWKGSSQDFLSS